LIMKRKSKLGLLIFMGLILANISGFSQKLVESIAAIVGNEVVYLSDIENTVSERRRNGDRTPLDELRCKVFQELLVSKLFLDQARIDSIEVTDDAVEGDLNLRMNDAIRQAGSEKTLENAFKKSIVEIRRDLRKALVENQIIAEVQSKITANKSITPNDVKRYFSGIPRDSLPVVPARVQLSIIQLDPPDNEANKAEARQKLLNIRSEILAGKSFSVLAILNSEDPGTAANGGEVGYKLRGELEKEYADAAFSLTKNTVSKIVETKYGFHIIQLIDRRGEMVNTRHILIRPKVKPDEAQRAMSKLDSLANLIRKDSLKFENVALKYSTHLDSKINGGKFVSTNPGDRTTWFSLDELPKDMYLRLREMKIGEISDAFSTTDDNGNIVFRIVRLDNEVPAHRANLKDDYQFIANAAMMYENQEAYSKWVSEKIKTTYIKISNEFRSCKFLDQGWLQ
jgi:peptidyl-prolyl cis-trans isomerase SurA